MKNSVRKRRTCLAVVGLLLAAVVGSPLSAQQAAGVGTVEGVIKEANTGRFIENAQVAIVGAGLGAVTNHLGFYRILNVPARSVEITVRMVGFTPQRKSRAVAAGATITADFDLFQTALQLQAVVTTGTAGATEVKRLGNTIASIEAPKFAPIMSPSELLQGREAGVVGLTTSGLAGEGMRIRIRGNASLTQNNEPVVFVDGVRINSNGSSSAGSSLSRIDDIDPSTIVRLEIMLGSAAASLFGTEASSGVIQIFRKRGVCCAP